MPMFTTSDRVRLHYELGGEPGGVLPPVVLCHGFCSSIELNWRESGVLDALHAAGRRTVAIDARGHGRSEGPHEVAAYGESRMAEDARELIDHLDLERIDLVGYSMGSIVALLLTVSDPRVRRLVIGGVGAAVAETGGVGRRALPDGLVDALLADRAEAVTDPQGREWRDFVDASGGDRFALAAQARAMHATPIPLERIIAPTLLIVGDADLATGSRPKVLAAAIPDARLELLTGTHMDLFARPTYATALTEFLAQ